MNTYFARYEQHLKSIGVEISKVGDHWVANMKGNNYENLEIGFNLRKGDLLNHLENELGGI